MLQLPQDPDLRDSHDCTALIVASEAGQTGVVQLLLEAGADTDLTDED